jgi:hypothetical protein
MSVEDAHLVDFISFDPTGEIVLIMVEGREWDGSNRRRLFELQEKVNSYASFACEGQLFEQHPELVGKQVRLELRCISPPDPATAKFLDMVREKLMERGLPFAIKQIRTSPSG